MINNLELKLHNWRCFGNSHFSLPLNSLIILGKNGSGKTSLLSSVYSLYTKKAWPKTKFFDHLKNQTQYFGISSQFSNWSLTAKVGANGKLVNKYQRPIKPPIASDQWPKILTYSPEDNYWLSLSRSQKLGYFDDFLKVLFEKDFQRNLKQLEKITIAKQRLIKKKVQENQPVDMVFLSSLNKEILQLSVKIWHYRWYFIQKIKHNINNFSDWINSPLKNWKLDWEMLDLTGKYCQVEDLEKFLEIILDQSSQSIFWQELWKKELILQKNLFGANKDSFNFKSNQILANQSLSRGENRLLILFIKKLLQETLLEKNKDAVIWWFLDDVFNEFDPQKEILVKEKILNTSHLYFITATKKPKFEIQEFYV